MRSIDLGKEYGFGFFKSFAEVLNVLLPTIFAIAGAGVLFYFLIGAFRWLISGGDKNTIQAAKDMIVHAIIGFILLMVIFLIVQFIPEFLGLGSFKIVNPR